MLRAILCRWLRVSRIRERAIDKAPHECIVLHFTPAMIPGHDASASDTLVPLSRLLADARKGVAFHGVTRKRAVKLMAQLGTCRPLEGLSRFYELLDVLC